MTERNRYGQERGHERHGREDKGRENDWSRGEARSPGPGRGRVAADHEESSARGQGQGGMREEQGADWESGAGRGGYGREHGGYGSQGGGFAQWEPRGGWQPGRGYGSQGGGGYGSQGGGWDLDEGRFQSGRGWQEAQGAQERSGQAGYGPGGYGGYGSPGGYGGSHAYGPQERGWQGSQRWQGARESEGSSYGGQGPHSYGGYGTRGGSYGEAGSASWMGEGYGGPTPEETRSGRYDFGRWGTASRSGRRAQQRWPKSYTRSDERIREDLYERILQHDHIDATDVSISVTQGNVTLEGTVPERHMKHDIENIADECPGVKDIDNKIRVHSQGPLFVHAGEPGGDTATGGATSYTGGTSTAAPSGSGKK